MCISFHLYLIPTVCRGSVRDVMVEIESATTATVSWFPPDIELWNGVITSYTVIYELIRRVDMDDIESLRDPLSSHITTVPQSEMTNNPDPTIATLPLKRESALVNMLEEFYVYRFSVFLENAVGHSNISGLITVEMPPAGTITILNIANVLIYT